MTRRVCLFPHPRSLTPTPGPPGLVVDFIHDQFTKFPMGRPPGSLGISALHSSLAQMGTNLCAWSIYPLSPRPFAQSLDTTHPHHPSNELTASKSPRISPSHSITLHPPYPHLLTCPRLEPLQTTSRNHSRSLQNIPSRLYPNLRAKQRTLSPAIDRFRCPLGKRAVTRYGSSLLFPLPAP